MEGEVFLVFGDGDDDVVAGREFSFEDFNRERVLDEGADGALERAGAVFGLIAFFG